MGNHLGLSSEGWTRERRDPAGIERVRAHLLTALHLGRLRPGDRVPSVRRLADLTGLNRKTVHRAYRRLVEEGLLSVRPGSGTFVAEIRSPSAGRTLSAGELVSAVNRCRAEAVALGLPPELFTGFLSNYLGGGLQHLPVTVVECNREQIDVMVRHLSGALGLDCRPVTLDELGSDPARAVRAAWGIVTTDCHLAEVAGLVAPLGTPVYRVALDPDFPRRVLDLARAAPGWMVVEDPSFIPVFRRLLESLPGAGRLAERVHLVGTTEARAAMRLPDGHRWIWISPLVDPGLSARIPFAIKRVSLNWTVAPTAFERLRARLALDLAVRSSRA